LLPVAQARIRRLTGDVDSAVALLDSAGEQRPATGGWLSERIHCEQARVELARGRPDHAVKILDGFDATGGEVGEILAFACLGLHDEEQAERILAVLPARGAPATVRVGAMVADAALHLRRHDRSGALARLDHAFHVAAPEHIRRPFREAPTDLRRLLDATPALAATLRHPPTERPTPTVVEPLTARELEVLVHLADMLSTDEIAEAMFVSVNTVRTHVRNVLRKLGVSRRGDAVRRARTLKLLASRPAGPDVFRS
jgi:LuxR family maltose regulon positive regulatory protein